MKNKCKRSALRLRNKGISVIPIRPDKKPYIAWKEYTERIATEDEITKWWQDYPDANLGIVTGKISNLTVVDVEEGGLIDYLPETLTVATGGGGFHLYYRYSDKFKNAVRIRDLTDIRNDSGYVIAPPSIHKSGKQYTYHSKKAISQFPEHLFLTEIIKQRKNDWNVLLKGVSSGNRNQVAAKICGLILTKTPFNMWEYVAWPAVRDWNQHNKPPLPEDELRATFDSISGRVLYSQNDSEREILNLTDLAKRYQEEKKEATKAIVPSGFETLDFYLNGGFRPGDLILVGARPSVGKSSFALSVAYNAAKVGKKVLFFSIEMTSLELYERLLSFHTGIPASLIINGTANKKEIEEGSLSLSKLPIQLAELSKATSKEVVEIAQRQLLESEIDLIVVDYVQYLRDKHKSGNDSTRVGEISKNLKSLARSTKIPVLCPCQLNRKTEEGGNTRMPRLSDLRDSGNLEQDADTVILLHRRSTSDDHKSKTNVIVAKQRKGETGQLDLHFNLQTTRFENDPIE
ncbi:MAG: DnaB-like helicase C-terminal domain-containing protein [Saccharofermentanales bacterium]